MSHGKRSAPEDRRIFPVTLRSRDAVADETNDELSILARTYRRAAPILDGVWKMVGGAGAGALGGWWLDGKLGTAPWLLMAGALGGAAGGMWAFIRAALSAGRKEGDGAGK
jgi:ATP synthase protein I